MSHFKEIHEVRAKYFKKDFPASTLVQVSRLVDEDMLIEIEAFAVLN
jgi:2-iminobutanoate/2-iminopropanoate deaminase